MENTLRKRMITLLARRVAQRYAPFIIGVTGSVGGATTLRAIESVVKHEGVRYRLSGRSSDDALNLSSAILGVPLTKNFSFGDALRMIIRGVRHVMLPRSREYPQVIVAEYAADEAGEMKSALAVAVPNVGIFTSLAPVHIHAFQTLERAFKEKAQLIRAVSPQGCIVLAGDDPTIAALKEKSRSRVITYGFGERCDVRAVEVQVTQESADAAVHIDGTNVKLVYGGGAVPTFLANVVGGPHIHAALAASAVGIVRGMNLVQISEALRGYRALPGRMGVVAGIKNTLIIDDTYNASSVSCAAALKTLAQLTLRSGGEKFAVIGTMMYLGDYTEEQYRVIGETVVAEHLNYLVTVGRRAAEIGGIAKSLGMEESRVYHFESSAEAGRFVQDRLESGDALIVSGSEEARLEVIVRELMGEPLRAKELLVRQGK